MNDFVNAIVLSSIECRVDYLPCIIIPSTPHLFGIASPANLLHNITREYGV
jgi:hypothetical protein